MSEPRTTGDHLSDEALSAWLDGRLDADEQTLADRHLGTCRDCARRYAGLRATRDALRHLEPPPLPRDFRLNDRGRPRQPAGVPASRPIVIAARWLSAAVTLCGIVLLFLAFTTSGGVRLATSAGTAAAERADPAPSVTASYGTTGHPITGPGSQPVTPTTTPTALTPTGAPVTPTSFAPTATPAPPAPNAATAPAPLALFLGGLALAVIGGGTLVALRGR